MSIVISRIWIDKDSEIMMEVQKPENPGLIEKTALKEFLTYVFNRVDTGIINDNNNLKNIDISIRRVGNQVNRLWTKVTELEEQLKRKGF